MIKTIFLTLVLLCGSALGQVAQPEHGGTGQSTYTKGDVLCANGTNTLSKLAVGANGNAIVADSTQPCGIKYGPVAGSGTEVQVNGVDTSSQTPINFLTSSAINGFTLSFTNTSAGIIQLGLSGTLNNAGITNPQVTVNGHVCTLGNTCAVVASDVGNGTAQWNANQINGVSMSGLGTGIIKNTTGTGAPSIAVAGDFPILNQNTLGSAASFTGSLAGDVTGLQGATVVGKINGVSLGSLATGIVKNTNGVGTPSIAVAGDFPTLNQNTTGSSAKWTTPRSLAGNSVDGSADVNFTNKFIAQGTSDAGLTNAQFLGNLSSGFARVTTNTGVISSTELSGDATTSGNGVVTVIKINGNSVPSGALANQVLVCNASNVCVWKTMPDCVGSSNALNYTQSTFTFSCLSISTLTNPMTTPNDIIIGGTSGAVQRLAAPTGVNGVPQVPTSTPSGGVAGAITWSPSGVVPRASTCGSNVDTILAADRSNYITWSDASPCAVTLPQAGSTGFASNIALKGCNIGAGLVTITPTTSTISYTDGSTYTSGASNVTLATGKCIVVFSDGTNYFANAQAVVARGIAFSIGDPGGSALSSGATTTAYVTVPFGCKLSAYNLLVDAGTVTVKFWKIATGTAIPTSSNSINTSGVSISSGTAIHSTTMSDFTSTTVTANDIMAMNVTTVATAKYVVGVLQCDQ